MHGENEIVELMVQMLSSNNIVMILSIYFCGFDGKVFQLSTLNFGAAG